jgi:hypothetical protein
MPDMGTSEAKVVRSTGSVYLHVLGASLLVTIIGLAAVSAVRLQTRDTQRAGDCVEARTGAVSAVELGLLYVEQDPNWRTTWPNGAWLSDETLGDGTFTLEGTDPQDGDLTDSEFEPLILTGTGMSGIARHKAQVTLVPVIEPFAALNCGLHASGTVTVDSGKSITVTGASLSTNGILDVGGTVDGDAEADTVQGSGSVTGSTTAPAGAKPLPPGDIVTTYANRATALPSPGAMDKIVLGPGYNPWGPADPNGLYYIDTGGSDLTIQNSRIYGTLVVRAGAGTLFLDSAVFAHSYRPDFPTLLVDGDVVLSYQSSTIALSEAGNGANYNPSGAPYGGQSDSDQADVYPNEVQGLVHVIGSLVLRQSALVRGVVICEGAVNCQEFNTIIHVPGLYTSPPDGYTHVERMKISPGSWQ